jgi:ribosomal-protein-alanine N-acetyltransferase
MTLSNPSDPDAPSEPGWSHALIAGVRALTRAAEDEARFSLLAGNDLDAYVQKLAELAELVTWSEAGKICAFMAFYCNDSTKDSAFVTMVIVDPSFRRRGIGRALLELVLATARARSFRACRLRVHSENHAALAMYRARGFAAIDTSTPYWLLELPL